MRSEASLSDAHATRVMDEGASAVAMVLLAELSGQEVDPTRGIGEQLIGVDSGPTPPLEQVISTAREARPETKALRKALAATRA